MKWTVVTVTRQTPSSGIIWSLNSAFSPSPPSLHADRKLAFVSWLVKGHRFYVHKCCWSESKFPLQRHFKWHKIFHLGSRIVLTLKLRDHDCSTTIGLPGNACMERAALPVSNGEFSLKWNKSSNDIRKHLGQRLIFFIYKHNRHLNFTVAFSLNIILIYFCFQWTYPKRFCHVLISHFFYLLVCIFGSLFCSEKAFFFHDYLLSWEKNPGLPYSKINLKL